MPVSSFSRYRHRLKPDIPQSVKTCVYDDHSNDRTGAVVFPLFTKDLYLSVFPAPLNATDRRIDDDKEADPGQFMKILCPLGSGRLGKSYTAHRVDMTPYSSTTVPKKDIKHMVVLTKMDAKRVDYMDMVRAVEPFTLARPDISLFLSKVLLTFRSTLPYKVEYYYIVSEYLHQAVSLCHRLQQLGRMTEDHAKFYIVELIEAVASVHKYGKIIRRLCLCNLVIDNTGHLKLLPYCLCEQNLDCGQSCNMLVKNCGDQFYASPEVVFGVDVQFSADWWSVGVILYQLMTGELPFTGRTLGDLGKSITECPMIPPDYVSGEAAAFLRHMLHKDPRRRLGFSDSPTAGDQGTMNVKDHPFFQRVLWRSVRGMMETPPYIPRKDIPSALDVFREKVKSLPVKGNRLEKP
ncbi:unnamed protein product [Candidula unifasciata]|uniref:non-specific serine/threonine protein kinase n=1 Tax=Candidula unifasciata TaxID=100452 RepID=A0A8S3YIS6_9EUPU|nr:unnamed protein product [Candidula unifasciata]